MSFLKSVTDGDTLTGGTLGTAEAENQNDSKEDEATEKSEDIVPSSSEETSGTTGQIGIGRPYRKRYRSRRSTLNNRTRLAPAQRTIPSPVNGLFTAPAKARERASLRRVIRLLPALKDLVVALSGKGNRKALAAVETARCVILEQGFD